MADRELIAAILTAGMLPTLEVPQSRARARNGPVIRAEGDAIQSAVDHSLGLYRLVLNELGVDPLTPKAGRDAQTQAPAAATQNGATGLPGHDTPHTGESALAGSRTGSPARVAVPSGGGSAGRIAAQPPWRLTLFRDVRRAVNEE
jgi:hypothetical protein